MRPVGQFVWQSTECKSVRHVLEETESDLHHADSSSTPPSNVNCSKICVLLHSRIQQPVWAFRWNKTKYRTLQRPPPHFSFNWIDCSMQSVWAQNIQRYSEYTAAMIFCLLQLLAFMLACKEQCVMCKRRFTMWVRELVCLSLRGASQKLSLILCLYSYHNCIVFVFVSVHLILFVFVSY